MDKIYNVLLDALLNPDGANEVSGRTHMKWVKIEEGHYGDRWFVIDDKRFFCTEDAYEYLNEFLKKEEKEWEI